MSSLRKAAKSGQKEHRERHQPGARKHLGLLEKKKDYKIRARAFEVKKNKLKKLKKKALNRNPDEFYFHMINSETKDGLHYEKPKAEEHTEAQLKLMQTQDIKYVTYKKTVETKKIEKLKSNLHLLEAESKPTNTHTFFVDSSAQVKKFDVASRLQTHPSLLNRTYNRPRIQDLDKLEFKGALHKESIENIRKQKQQQYQELSNRIEREKELNVLSQKLDVKKKLANQKDRPLKLLKKGTKTSAPVYVWRKERKR